MAQAFQAVPSNTTLAASRPLLVERDDALRSNFSGTSDPTEAVVGQIHIRTDQGRAYICTNATGPVFQELVSWLLANVSGVVSYSDIQNVSAQYRLLGRSSAGAGAMEEITASANVFTLLGSASYAAFRTSLDVYSKSETATQISNAIAALVDTAPTTLDTLNELAAALGDDPNFAATMTTQLGLKLNSSSYTAADVLSKLLTVDGAASGLDADLLDGQQGSYYLDLANATGNLALARVPNDLLTYAKIQNVSTNNRVLGRITAGAGDIEELTAANLKTILSLAQADISGLTTASSPQFTGIELGHATDTTLTRLAAGVMGIEGKAAVRVNSGSAANSGLVTWGTGAPGTLAEGEIYLRYA